MGDMRMQSGGNRHGHKETVQSGAGAEDKGCRVACVCLGAQLLPAACLWGAVGDMLHAGLS